jgi:hypothetical protein
MPNWCANSLQITGTKEQIAELETKLDDCKGKDFFNIFGIPDSDAAGAGDDWYAYNLENYGCKWNCTASSWDTESGDGTTITISFDSPWAPPNKLFEAIADDYTEVLAYYYEPGMAFCGRFQDGYDECYDIPGTAEEARDTIPDDIDDFFCISEQIEDNEEDDEEDDE